MIKAVAFDLDGTLLDRDVSVRKFIVKQYERLHTFVGHITKEKYVSRFIELDCRGYTRKDKVYQQMIEEFEIKGLPWEELLEDYLIHFKNHCEPFPNLIETLEKLKNKSLKLGIITNGRGQFQLDNIKALGIEKYFETILISEWEGMKKPEPEIFERLLEKLNLAANECVFVGDHPDNDVKGAQSIGMIGIWKKDQKWNNVSADYIIDDLGEIPGTIEKINR
ncbi:HAD family hydrolase [Robertmurraya yapensis]|uniref:HAD family hydrolase n=2 Tax=Bacillaceae TaxID=186817 RepID=A0A3S0KQ55_9BACI|nr:HAD family hydrolase [Bacillus yapensis]RTR31928.1 HAD family hydrolase [Bacillus yapensis]TKS95942.1 HAD family hydrolase [Bacillus yapensis]